MSGINVAWWVGEAMNDETSNVLAVSAGLGSGKTHGVAQWHHYLSFYLNRDAPFSAFMEPSFQKIHDAAIPKFRAVLRDFGLSEHRDFRIIKSPYPKLIYTATGHEIHFLSAETPDKIVAAEYSHASEDESGIIDKEATDNLRGRIRDGRAKRRQFFRSGAPQGITAFAEEFDSETLPGWDTSRFRDHTKDLEVEGTRIRKRRFVAWTDDNPHLPADYIPTLVDTYGHNAALIQAYRYGRFVPFNTGSAYSNYLPQKHDTPDNAPDPMREVVFTWDFNANPLAWVALQRVPFDEFGARVHRWVALHESQENSGQLDDAVVEFAIKHPVADFKATPIRIFGDRTGHAQSHKVSGSDFDAIARLLRELGYRVVEVCATRRVAPEASSVEAVQRLFLNSLLLVSKRCRNLRKSLMGTTWQEGVRKLSKPSGEKITHWSDALKYWAWQETRDETDAPQRKIYGVNK